MTDVSITVPVLVVAVAAFVWNRLPVEIVALGEALSLFGTGVITLEDAFSGFGSGSVVLIAAFFVVADAIDAAGITAWHGGLLIRSAGASRVRLVLLTMGITAALTSYISVNGADTALLPKDLSSHGKRSGTTIWGTTCCPGFGSRPVQPSSVSARPILSVSAPPGCS